MEEEFLKSHFVILNESGNKKGRHIKKLPFAFAEQGIYMLATVLRGGFHYGASSEDAGRKVCAINKIYNNLIIHTVIDKLLLEPEKVI